LSQEQFLAVLEQINNTVDFWQQKRIEIFSLALSQIKKRLTDLSQPNNLKQISYYK